MQQTTRKKKHGTYEVNFTQGNMLATIKCKEIMFPGNQDHFMTIRDVIFPMTDTNAEAIFLPKHLIISIKEIKREENPLKVVDINEYR